ncbi:hypothetical protein [Streptomyces erythrochromogenes]|uniref:hypothetical protein n=1 Tax=Streptomyces erythrochromogenes TaxID=285574 RepID=UPI003865C31E|nr:hypothetical protein OG489_37905 [Streptomyces erythrochromogenes]
MPNPVPPIDSPPGARNDPPAGTRLPVQEPVEREVARGVPGPDAAWQGSRPDDEAAERVLLTGAGGSGSEYAY